VARSLAASCRRMSHTRLSSALFTKNCPARTKPPPMIELTIDSTAFAITPVPLSEPWRVVATHAGRKQTDCQGSERTRSWLLASTTARARDPLARAAADEDGATFPRKRLVKQRTRRLPGNADAAEMGQSAPCRRQKRIFPSRIAMRTHARYLLLMELSFGGLQPCTWAVIRPAGVPGIIISTVPEEGRR
jgi:hypothetical protein